eukprot:4319411-Amphidinium_carterae.1
MGACEPSSVGERGCARVAQNPSTPTAYQTPSATLVWTRPSSTRTITCTKARVVRRASKVRAWSFILSVFLWSLLAFVYNGDSRAVATDPDPESGITTSSAWAPAGNGWAETSECEPCCERCAEGAIPYRLTIHWQAGAVHRCQWVERLECRDEKLC